VENSESADTSTMRRKRTSGSWGYTGNILLSMLVCIALGCTHKRRGYCDGVRWSPFLGGKAATLASFKARKRLRSRRDGI
jgi:hypothetical protein